MGSSLLQPATCRVVNTGPTSSNGSGGTAGTGRGHRRDGRHRQRRQRRQRRHRRDRQRGRAGKQRRDGCGGRAPTDPTAAPAPVEITDEIQWRESRAADFQMSSSASRCAAAARHRSTEETRAGWNEGPSTAAPTDARFAGRFTIWPCPILTNVPRSLGAGFGASLRRGRPSIASRAAPMGATPGPTPRTPSPRGRPSATGNAPPTREAPGSPGSRWCRRGDGEGERTGAAGLRGWR